MQKMNYWGEKWDLHVDICPCDVHFNEWVEASKIVGKTIYHFGTGTHHVVGLRQAELGNTVFAITASKEEYDAYVALVTGNSRVAKSYLAYFGDIYLAQSAAVARFRRGDAVSSLRVLRIPTPPARNTAASTIAACST